MSSQTEDAVSDGAPDEQGHIGESPDDVPDHAIARIRDEVRLASVATGLEKQYDNFHDALMEVVDNGVSAVVKDQTYFEDPDDTVEINITIIRKGSLVWFVVADNGTGITKQTAIDTLFRLSDTSEADGILNNVGWGLKQSLSWFEAKVRDDGVRDDGDHHTFKILTSTEEADTLYAIDGPIDSDKSLYLREADTDEWTFGIDGMSNLDGHDHGTRVHIPCSWAQVNDDLWGGEDTSLTTRAQALRENLGMRFRRLLNVHEDNRIVLTVKDETDGGMFSGDVHPIDLQFEEYTGEDRPVTFEVTGDGVDYYVEYERGKLDIDAMVSAAKEQDDMLVTSGDNFRSRYKTGKKHQGVEVYANGRVMMTSVLTELYQHQNDPDKYISRDDTLNEFGGELRIVPKDPDDQVPTDNRKVAVDTSSEVWEEIEEKLRELGGVTRTWDKSDNEPRNNSADPFAASADDTDGTASMPASLKQVDEADTDSESKQSPRQDTQASGTETTGTDQYGTSDDTEASTGDTDGNPSAGAADTHTADKDGNDTPRDASDLTHEEFKSRHRNGELDHDDYVDRLAAELEEESLTKRVSMTDGFGGTPTDVVQYLENDQVIIWEVKPHSAQSRDIFQTMMYQDHFKREDDGNEFNKAVLLSDTRSKHAKKDIRNASDRRDEQGDTYSIEQADIENKLL